MIGMLENNYWRTSICLLVVGTALEERISEKTRRRIMRNWRGDLDIMIDDEENEGREI